MKEVWLCTSQVSPRKLNWHFQSHRANQEWNKDCIGFICCPLYNFSKSNSLLRYKEYWTWNESWCILVGVRDLNLASYLTVRKKILALVKKLYNIFVPYYSGRPWYDFFFSFLLEDHTFALPTKRMAARIVPTLS